MKANSMSIGRAQSRPDFAATAARHAGAALEWLRKGNETFSLLCQEPVTNGQVVKAHVVFTAGLVAACLAGTIFGG